MNRKEGGQASTVVALGLLAIIGVCAFLILDSCSAKNNSAATLARAEAEAYQVRQQADTAAAVERASIREAGRQAGHERMMEMVPTLLIITAIILGIVSGGVIAFYIINHQRPQAAQAPPPQIILIERGEPRQALADIPREAWPLLADVIRRAQQGREIVTYDERSRRCE